MTSPASDWEQAEFTESSRKFPALNTGITTEIRDDEKDGMSFTTIISALSKKGKLEILSVGFARVPRSAKIAATKLASQDSDRTRSACLKILNRWSIYFFRERVVLLCRLQSMAIDIGEQLASPRLSGR